MTARCALAAVAALAALAAAGCSLGPGREAGALCPAAPQRMEAWINRMPGPGNTGPRIIVLVELAAPAAAILTRDPAPPRTLALRLRPSGGEAAPAVRYSARHEGYARVTLGCGGETLHVVDSIESVY